MLRVSDAKPIPAQQGGDAPVNSPLLIDSVLHVVLDMWTGIDHHVIDSFQRDNFLRLVARLKIAIQLVVGKATLQLVDVKYYVVTGHRLALLLGVADSLPFEIGCEGRLIPGRNSHIFGIRLLVEILGSQLQSFPPTNRHRPLCNLDTTQQWVVVSEIIGIVGDDQCPLEEQNGKEEQKLKNRD